MEKITKKKFTNTPRHTARIAAVQALYQYDQTKENIDSIVSNMINGNFHSLFEEGYTKPDISLFEEICSNIESLLPEIDTKISQFLSENWRLERISYTLRSILRLATFELLKFHTISERIIINEYVEVTKAFSETPSDASFVNGILDKISKDVRQ